MILTLILNTLIGGSLAYIRFFSLALLLFSLSFTFICITLVVLIQLWN